MPPRSLAAFLKAARAVLSTPAAKRPTPLTIVVGNESADLDSLCSAVLTAYFRSHSPPHSAPNALHIPLCNLPREDLKLRPELAAALSSFSSSSMTQSLPPPSGIPLDSLITLSDLPDDLSAADTRWLLVDHNELTGDLERRFTTASIIGCIDHHVDEGVVPQPDSRRGLGPRVIEPAGSCASLVLREFRDTWTRLAAEAPDMATDRILARLALAPILVDVSNLKDVNKTVDADRQSAALAEAVLGGGDDNNDSDSIRLFSYERDPTYERTAFFEQLSRLKDDIAGFSYSDVLRKDYKQWQELPGVADKKTQKPLTLGMSTVTRGFDYLLSTIGDEAVLLDALSAFARQRGLDIAAIMTVQADDDTPGLGRQLLLWAFTQAGAEAVRIFVHDNTERLQLTPWGNGKLDAHADAHADTLPAGWRKCWTQGSVKYSRKQLAPYLREAMRRT